VTKRLDGYYLNGDNYAIRVVDVNREKVQKSVGDMGG